MAASILALLFWGLRVGIDFKGGLLLEVEYRGSRPESADVAGKLTDVVSGASVRPTGERGYIIRVPSLTPDARLGLLERLQFDGERELAVKRMTSIGGVLGREATRSAFVSIILVLLAIVVFITVAFRKVSEPVSSWKYGVIAVGALFHDVLIPTGVFSVLGKFSGVEVDTLFVTALLVIFGFSVHDTIVVFDRVRENLKRNREYREGKSFDRVVGESVSETLTRSINTSLTTLFALVVLLLFGPAATQWFALALIIGIIAGTYSSICLASPLLVSVGRAHLLTSRKPHPYGGG